MNRPDLDEMLNTFAARVVDCVAFADINPQGARPRWQQEALDARAEAADAIVQTLHEAEAETALLRAKLAEVLDDFAAISDEERVDILGDCAGIHEMTRGKKP